MAFENLSAFRQAWDQGNYWDAISAFFQALFSGNFIDALSNRISESTADPTKTKDTTSTTTTTPKDANKPGGGLDNVDRPTGFFNTSAAYKTFQRLDNLIYGLNKKGRSGLFDDGGRIDCSGFITAVVDDLRKDMNSTANLKFRNAIYNINPKTGKPYTDEEDLASIEANKKDPNVPVVYRHKNSQQMKEGLAALVRETGGQVITGKGSTIQVGSIRDGTIITLNTGYKDWERKIRSDGDDHIAYVTKDSKGNLVVIDSNGEADSKDGKDGAQSTPLEEWIKRYPNADMTIMNIADAAAKMGNKPGLKPSS